jgi:hypothetical protein
LLMKSQGGDVEEKASNNYGFDPEFVEAMQAAFQKPCQAPQSKESLGKLIATGGVVK